VSGLFGVISKKSCINDLFYGTDYQSHLGTQRAGLAVMNGRIYRSIHNISTSQFKSRFIGEISQMKGTMGIGIISDAESQPIIICSSFGTFSIATAGRLTNKNKLAKEIIKEGGSLSELSDGKINTTEVAGKIIAQKTSLVEGINHLFNKIKGSLCILVLTKEGIYAARDRFGRTTLVIAKNSKGNIAVSSETCAFPNLGYQIIKELSSGEIVSISKKGELKQEVKPTNTGKTCAFLWIYTGYPASSYDGINVETVREHCGENLAKRDDVKADFVTGIPDSGIAHALGYAKIAKIPYRRPLVKYTPGYGRSYTPPNQKIRDKVAQMKLIPIESVIRGKKIVVCDDSIVRGTQLKNQAISKLWFYGAKEIHVRIACPPLMFPCPYLLSTKSKTELAARRAIKSISNGRVKETDIEGFINQKSKQYLSMVEKIRKEVGVTSLKYQRVDDMVEAIGLPKEKLCLYCWSGKE